MLLRTSLLCISLFILNTCGPQVHLRVLEPVGIPRAARMKRLSVAQLSQDTFNIGSQIEVKLASVRIEGKPYFTVISRDDLKRILQEQRLQNSGLVNAKQAVALGELMGAHAIISGSIGPKSVQISRSVKERTKCSDPLCKQEKIDRVPCAKMKVQLALQLKLVDVQGGDIIYGHQDQQEQTWSACEGEANPLPTQQEVLMILAQKLVDRFIEKLAPKYVSYSISLISEPDIALSSSALEQFLGGVKFLEKKRYDRAQRVFEGLAGGEGSKSIAVLYHLGVSLEAQGQLTDALRIYEHADQIALQPVDLISEALKRIHKRLDDQGELRKQLGKSEIE